MSIEDNMMNEVSIIINGERYDAVEIEPQRDSCYECDFELCKDFTDTYHPNLTYVNFCNATLSRNCVFKKSTKSFER